MYVMKKKLKVRDLDCWGGRVPLLWCSYVGWAQSEGRETGCLWFAQYFILKLTETWVGLVGVEVTF